MANLNLSQFTEKTLVADADWVFVWDTAGAISKKVSRNSLLNSGTLATSAPVTISQTWNDALVAFTAFKVNATTPGSTSAAGSLLLDLQVGGTSQLSVRKSGQVIGSDGTALLPTYGFFDAGWGAGFSGMYRYGTGLGFSTAGGSVSAVLIQHTGVRLHNSLAFGWTNGTAEGTLDTILVRDSASGNTLALRNSTAAQTFRVYNTYTDASSYERGLLGFVSNEFFVGTQQAGAGTGRDLVLTTSGSVRIVSGGTARWVSSVSGNFLAWADNSYDIGASGANRPRDINVGRYVIIGSSVGSTGAIGFSGRSYIKSVSDGLFTLSNTAETDFNRLQFGGTSASFPALKRSTTTLQARLADDSAFAPIQGKLTTDTAFTSGAITDTGYIVLYDSTGTAYKVACTPV